MSASRIRGLTPTLPGGYTSQPTHLRLWCGGDVDARWLLDAADDDGNYTEEISQFGTFEQAVQNMPAFIDEITARYSPRWRFVTEYDPYGGAKHRVYDEN